MIKIAITLLSSIMLLLFFSCATERLVYKTEYIKPEILQLEKLNRNNRKCEDLLNDYEQIIDIYNQWYDQYYSE